jgi:AraC family transcriptional regulator of adaptative response / DNA-3-methyladenine glycosylase II
VPGCWNAFELATRAILGQQVSVRAATTLAGRIVKAFGRPLSPAADLTHLFPEPDVLAEADIASVGLPRARAETIRTFARAVRDGRFTFEGVVDMEAFLARLCAIPGIGEWTAQYVAMRALGEPDAFPADDLGLQRALDSSSARELVRRAEAWRPWRAYAAMYLWTIAGESVRGRRKPVSSRVRRSPASAQSAADSGVRRSGATV